MNTDWGSPSGSSSGEGKALEVLNGVVCDVADCSSVELLKVVDVGQLVLRQRRLDRIERVDVSQWLIGPGLDDLHRIGADEAVTGETLTTFDAFEQV